jgi:hypothetical protein
MIRGMDESEYRQAYTHLNELPCAFQKAILNRRCNCSRVRRYHIAEREAAGCDSQQARSLCGSFLGLVRENALFSLKLTGLNGPLPHNKELKVQAGGITGLLAVLEGENEPERKVEDIHGLLIRAEQEFPGLQGLPLPVIMRHVVHYKTREHRRRK